MDKKVFKFDLEKEIEFRPAEYEETNAEKYAKWVINKLSTLYNDNIKDGQLYNAVCISMNGNNINKLEKVLKPMDYIHLSPMENNNLKDDEFEIDFDKIVEEKQW